MMKAADFQPPDLEWVAGQPLKSTDPSTSSFNRGASASDTWIPVVVEVAMLSHSLSVTRFFGLGVKVRIVLHYKLVETWCIANSNCSND